MLSYKKISSDIFLLALLVVRLQIDFDLILNESFIRPPELREIAGGPTSIYIQTSPYSNILNVHRKRLEVDELDEAAILFTRLHFNNFVRQRRNNFIAYYSSSSDDRSATSNGNNADNPERVSSLPTNEASVPASGTLQEDEDPNWLMSELTVEDMNLIEILWKQDIDLGVSREAFDPHAISGVEGIEDVANSKEIHKDFYEVFGTTKPCDEEEIKGKPFPESNYTVDSETGELISDDFPVLCTEDEITDALLSDEPFIFLNQDSSTLLNAGNNDLSPDLFEQKDFTKQIVENYVDPDFLFSQIDEVEKDLEAYIDSYQSHESEASDVFSGVEDGWSDPPTMLPLTNLGMADSSSPDFRTRSQEGILQAAAMDSSAFEEQFYSIPTLLGPSSVGCALAESLATLHNDSDPGPPGSLINTIYVPQIPEMMHSCQNFSGPHSELSMNQFLTEDYQLVSKFSDMNPRIVSAEQIDSSNDSESYISGRIPSVSDYEENSQENGVYFSNAKANGITIKCEHLTKNESLSCGAEPIPDYFAGRAPNPYPLHHNHSYHLPFASSAKPSMRDKAHEEGLTHKDEKRAKELNIPISIDDIVNLSIEEYNERLAKHELTDEQLNLIRDIRRRGKNKVAAQNCRKRKMDQISSLQQDLVAMHNQKLQLKSKQECLMHEKHHIEEKYAQLHQIVSQFTNNNDPSCSNLYGQNDETLTIVTDSNPDPSDDFSHDRGAKTKRKFKK